jgi:hypothetical protein
MPQTTQGIKATCDGYCKYAKDRPNKLTFKQHKKLSTWLRAFFEKFTVS